MNKWINNKYCIFINRTRQTKRSQRQLMDWSDKINFQKSLHVINPLFLFMEPFELISHQSDFVYTVCFVFIIKFVIFCLLFFYVFCRSSHHWNKLFEYKQNQNVFPFYIELATCLCIHDINILAWQPDYVEQFNTMDFESVPNRFSVVYVMCEFWWCNFLGI